MIQTIPFMEIITVTLKNSKNFLFISDAQLLYNMLVICEKKIVVVDKIIIVLKRAEVESYE